jgi:hypothetical protein
MGARQSICLRKCAVILRLLRVTGAAGDAEQPGRSALDEGSDTGTGGLIP